MLNRVVEVIAEKFGSLVSMLDERARRLWAAAEANASGPRPAGRRHLRIERQDARSRRCAAAVSLLRPEGVDEFQGPVDEDLAAFGTDEVALGDRAVAPAPGGPRGWQV